MSWGEPSAESPPVCPRHPDVVSYVRCQRCGRPVCPACQRPAPVGIQCVDCVAESARRTRTATTVAGARLSDGRPVLTQVLIGLSVVAYAAQMLVPGFTNQFIFAPSIGWIEPWRFLTTTFLHGGIMHLAFNMYALYLVGPTLERVMGRWRFLSLYLLAAFGGSVAVLLFSSPAGPMWNVGTVGASGAVFGLFAALGLTLRRIRQNHTQIAVLIAINFALGFVIANVSWQAHLGGLLVGAALAAAYLFGPRGRSRPTVALAITVGMGLLLVAAAALRYAAL